MHAGDKTMLIGPDVHETARDQNKLISSEGGAHIRVRNHRRLVPSPSVPQYVVCMACLTAHTASVRFVGPRLDLVTGWYLRA